MVIKQTRPIKNFDWSKHEDPIRREAAGPERQRAWS